MNQSDASIREIDKDSCSNNIAMEISCRFSQFEMNRFERDRQSIHVLPDWSVSLHHNSRFDFIFQVAEEECSCFVDFSD